MIRLAFVELCGFRGYSRRVRVDFASGFTVIDGRNGVGKSSLFDAVEFALLGTLEKYGNQTAAGESASDYIWWRGKGTPPSDRYVEVGFEIDDKIVSLRRTMLEPPDELQLKSVVDQLLDVGRAPESGLRQLCSTSIIRDEKIAELSLDLKEADRFRLLRDALGASDADRWIKRASDVLGLARKRLAVAENDVQQAVIGLNLSTQRVDQAKQLIRDDRAIQDARDGLLQYLGGNVPTHELVTAVQTRILADQAWVDVLASILDGWDTTDADRTKISETEASLAAAAERAADAEKKVRELDDLLSTEPAAAEVRSRADTFGTLLAVGREIGLQDGECPLCGKEQTDLEFQVGIASNERRVAKLDDTAVKKAKLEQDRQAAAVTLQAASELRQRLTIAREASLRRISELDAKLQALDLKPDVARSVIEARHLEFKEAVDRAKRFLAVVDTRSVDATLRNSLAGHDDAQKRRAHAEEKLAFARQAEQRAKLLHDTCRRASGEMLERQLEVVMPLMSELYQRLRPHPVWDEIAYKLRGDVQKFLTLQVGDELNPQFIYSSGQRRATGLAFLLAVNLSLTWNRWSTLMLDDPVQHIDDYRSIHLAEVLSKFVASGRQIICAAEDSALADMVARHLLAREGVPGKRITLGVGEDGALSVLRDEVVEPLPRNIFIDSDHLKQAQ